MDEIARRAGVGKDTLYRRWPSKVALVRDGILRVAEDAILVPQGANPREDLVRYLTEVVEYATTTSFGRILAGIVGEASRNPELAEAYRQFSTSRRRTTGVLLRRVLDAQGSTRLDDDLELELDLLFAPLYYRLLVTGGSLDRAFVDMLVARCEAARGNRGGEGTEGRGH